MYHIVDFKYDVNDCQLNLFDLETNDSAWVSIDTNSLKTIIFDNNKAAFIVVKTTIKPRTVFALLFVNAAIDCEISDNNKIIDARPVTIIFDCELIENLVSKALDTLF